MLKILKMTKSLLVQPSFLFQALNEEQTNLWPENQAHIDLALSLCIP